MRMSKGCKRYAVLALMVIMFIGVTAGATLFFYLRGLQPDDGEGVKSTAPRANERVNVLLLGQDAGLIEGGGHGNTRTDVMILASFYPKDQTINMLSIPRDTLANIPGYGNSKINAAHAYGGVPLAVETVEGLTTLQINYYVKVGFEAFTKLVDAVGGVELDVEQDMHYIDPYAEPKLVINLKAGKQRLDGDKAEQYIRYRDETGDIGRIGRQQKFLSALVDKLLSPANIFRLPEIARVASNYVETNMGAWEIAKYALIAQTVDRDKISMHTMPGYPDWVGGISYWVPKRQEFSTLLDQYFRNKATLANWDIKIEVLNGNGYPGAATKMKERLAKLGFQVVSVDDAENTNFQTTEVINHTTNLQKGKAVQATIKGSILRKEIRSDTEVDVTVIVGKDNPQ